MAIAKAVDSSNNLNHFSDNIFNDQLLHDMTLLICTCQSDGKALFSLHFYFLGGSNLVPELLQQGNEWAECPILAINALLDSLWVLSPYCKGWALLENILQKWLTICSENRTFSLQGIRWNKYHLPRLVIFVFQARLFTSSYGKGEWKFWRTILLYTQT